MPCFVGHLPLVSALWASLFLRPSPYLPSSVFSLLLHPFLGLSPFSHALCYRRFLISMSLGLRRLNCVLCASLLASGCSGAGVMGAVDSQLSPGVAPWQSFGNECLCL